MRVNTITMSVRLAQARLDKLLLSLHTLLVQPSAIAKQLISLQGSMESLSLLVPMGCLHKGPFQMQFCQRWSQSRQLWDLRVPFSPWFWSSVSPWLDALSLVLGVPILDPLRQVFLYTDACNKGGGRGRRHVDAFHVSGLWSDTETAWHFSRLELKAVFSRPSLQAFLSAALGKAVRLFNNNTMVAFYVSRQGGSSFLLPLSESRGNAPVVSLSWDCPFSQAHSRQT